VATILMIFLKMNCPNFSRLVWRRHTKFQIGMAAAIPLPAPLACDAVTSESLDLESLFLACRYIFIIFGLSS